MICSSTSALSRIAALLVLANVGSGSAADWPQWRGEHRDGHADAEKAPTSLAVDPKPAWRKPIGPGFASPVVLGETLVYLDEQDGREVVHAIDASNGKERWKNAFAPSFGDEWGSGPRSTPLLEGDRVYVQSCRGEFHCLSLQDGTSRWHVDFEKDFGVTFVGTKVNEGAAIRRGHNGSALIDDGRIVVPVGSTNGATFVCFEKLTGKVLWKSLNDETAYSSPIVATLAGTTQIVAFTADALVGLDRLSGQLLWRVPVKTAAKRHALSPVIVGDHQVVVASHSVGMMGVTLEKDSGGFKASTAWLNRDLKINLSTPTVVGDFIYGFGAGQEFVCVDAKDGHVRWSQPGFGKGAKTDYASTIAVGKTLMVLNDAGQLFLLTADPDHYRSLGQSQLCGKNWSFPAYTRGSLYARDGRELQRFDLVSP